MSDAEKDELYRSAPELGDYVCRLCGKCRTKDFDPESVFRLEAVFDRQMDDMRVGDSAQYALRERLKQWFLQQEVARREYAALRIPGRPRKGLQRALGAVPVWHRRGPQAEDRPREAVRRQLYRIDVLISNTAGRSSFYHDPRERRILRYHGKECLNEQWILGAERGMARKARCPGPSLRNDSAK